MLGFNGGWGGFGTGCDGYVLGIETVGTKGAAATGGATTVSTAGGSQCWHSWTEGGISRPHSGQIQWNINQMYTVMLCMPFRDLPYGTHLGTLSLIGIRSQGKFKAESASGLTLGYSVPPT